MSRFLWLLFLLSIQPLASCEQGADEEETGGAPKRYKDLRVNLTLPPKDKYLAKNRQFRFSWITQFCKQYNIDIDSIDVIELLDAAGQGRKILDEFTNALDKKIVSNESLSSKEYDKMMEVFTNVCTHNRYKGYKIFDLRLIQNKICVLAERIQFEET
jgi:hypothetical protein